MKKMGAEKLFPVPGIDYSQDIKSRIQENRKKISINLQFYRFSPEFTI